MSQSFSSRNFFTALFLGLALQMPVAFADITATPPSGSGFAVKDSTGASDRFRVEESGEVTIPGLVGAPDEDSPACFNSTTGQLGSCAAAAAGPLNYAYVYNTSAQVVALEADIMFSDNGQLSAGITHTAGTPAINVATAGVYEVSFSVSGVEPAQFALFNNGASVPGGVFGSGAGTQQNNGHVIIALAAGDVLTLRNHSSSAAVTLQTLAGGTQTNVNASIVIRQLD